MWLEVTYVAEAQFLDPEITATVARDRAAEFKIIDGRISTWTVDAFMEAVLAAQGDRTADIRKAMISRRRDKYQTPL